MLIPYVVPGIIISLTRKPDEDGSGACGTDGGLVAVKATLLFSLLKNVARQLLLVSGGWERGGKEGDEGKERGEGKEGDEGKEGGEGKEGEEGKKEEERRGGRESGGRRNPPGGE